MTATSDKVKDDMREMAWETPFPLPKFFDDGTVTLRYCPSLDARIPEEFLEKLVIYPFTFKKLLETERILLEHPIAGTMRRNKRNLPIEQAWEILENSRQFFRGKATV